MNQREPQDPGQWLRAARKAADMSQRDLARETGLTQVGISHIESGRSPNPRKSTKRLLAWALDCEPEDLFPVNGTGPSKR